MFNLLNWKNYLFYSIIIASFTLNGFQYFESGRQEEKIEKCNAKLVSRETADNIALALHDEQEKKLRLREQEAAKAQVESLKRMELLMKEKVPADCSGAIQWMIDQAN